MGIKGLCPKLNSVDFRVAGLARYYGANNSEGCLLPDPKLGSFFVTLWPTSWTLENVLDVLRLRARCSQAMFDFQILDIFHFPRAPPTHLIRVPKEGLALLPI